MTVQTLGYFVPELILLATALVVVVAGLLVERSGEDDLESERVRWLSAGIGIIGALASLVSLFGLLGPSRTPLDPLSGTFVVDHYAIFLKAILLVFAVITILLGYRFAETFRPHQSEFIGLALLATAGAMFISSAREMIELYVSLETLPIALYVMVAFNKGERRSSAGGFNYLVVGA